MGYRLSMISMRIFASIAILAIVLAAPSPAFATGGDDPEQQAAEEVVEEEDAGESEDVASEEGAGEESADGGEGEEPAAEEGGEGEEPAAEEGAEGEEPAADEAEEVSEEAAPEVDEEAEAPAEGESEEVLEDTEATPETEEAAVEEEGEADEGAPAEEETAEEGESVADVVEILAETDTILVDGDGEPVSMAEKEAEEIIEVADPWFEDPADATQVIAFQSSCVGWVVPAGYAGGTCTESVTPVQAAVDAAPAGATVYLEAGTFVEQVEIDKNLTLSGTTGTIIQSPSNLVDYFTTSSNNYPVIYVHDADDVTITGLTVDGDGQGNANYKFIGIGYYNAGGEISNNTVQNIMDTPFSGSQHGVGIYVYNDDGVYRTIVIEGNTVEDFQKTGIAVAGSDLDATIEDNDVTGAGPTTVTAQNGIQVSYGDMTAEITNNRVKDIWYTGGYWTASGILIYGTGDVEMSDNVVDGAQAGIYNLDTNVNSVNDTVVNSEWSVIAYGYKLDITMNITGADISGGTEGVEVYSSVDGQTHVTIEDSYIYDNEYGVYTNQSDTVINNSSLTGNDYEVYSDAPGDVDATGNWWGCWEGPDAADCETVFFGKVDYDPHLTVDITMQDLDRDGIENSADNCPAVSNRGQGDIDGDGLGDQCDADKDGDGVANTVDNCMAIANSAQFDDDADGVGNACDGDYDPSGAGDGSGTGTGDGEAGVDGFIPVTGAGADTRLLDLPDADLEAALLDLPDAIQQDADGSVNLACMMTAVTFLDEANYLDMGDYYVTVVGQCNYMVDGVQMSMQMALATLDKASGMLHYVGSDVDHDPASFDPEAFLAETGFEPGAILNSTLDLASYSSEALDDFAASGNPIDLGGLIFASGMSPDGSILD